MKNIIRAYVCWFILFSFLIVTSLLALGYAAVENDGLELTGRIGWVCAISALAYILVLAAISVFALKISYRKGLQDGFGNPVAAENVLKHLDVIQVLKCHRSAVAMYCIIEARDETTYVRFMKPHEHVRERRFFRVWIQNGEAHLRDLHEEIARVTGK